MGRFIKLGLEISKHKIRGLQNNLLDLISDNKMALITFQLIKEKHIKTIIKHIIKYDESPYIIEILKKCTVSGNTSIWENQNIIFKEFIQQN